MQNKIKINHLKEFVKALNNLPISIKNRMVSMDSIKEPNCNTPGCHAGLVAITAEDLPVLKEMYKEIYDINHNECNYLFKDWNKRQYSFNEWAEVLAIYLGFKDSSLLCNWARTNVKIWGNTSGDNMFNSGLAFDQDNDYFPHQVIIDKWTEVLDNLIKIEEGEELKDIKKEAEIHYYGLECKK